MPMGIQDENILCFSIIDWDYLWHRPQELMSRFARDDNRVLYVDTLGVRSPGMRDLRRVIMRLKHWLQGGIQGSRCVAENLYVYSPGILPFLNWTWAQRVNGWILQTSLRRIMQSLHFSQPIIWTYLPTRAVLHLIEGIGHKMLIYDCLDAIAYNPAGVVGDYAQTERRLVERADLVFATSGVLYRERAPYNEHIYQVPYGVNVDHYLQPGLENVPPPRDLAKMNQPRVGFFGAIDHRLDLELLMHLARAHPEWALVLIGSAKMDLSPILEFENVHFLGIKPHQLLPRYLAHLDVLIIPYLINEFTRHIYPAKIYECLASGKPVVATDLPELRSLSGVIGIASDMGQFTELVSRAMIEDTLDLRQRRIDIAKHNSWAARYEFISEKVAQRLHEEGIH
ncbi:MAG: glycosyltransferase family 1 protein [Chloroflexi bacterium]|nr:glycosyltransferase family 1 protein [Chloroflexota bacterium]